MKRLAKIGFLVLLGWASCAVGKECVGLITLQNQNLPPTSLMNNILSTLHTSPAQVLPPCSVVNGVLNKVHNQVKRGGTRLEGENPLNLAEAQTNLRAALNDTTVERRLAELQHAVKDDNTRLFFEASIFDDEGYYGARELRIQELQRRLR